MLGKTRTRIRRVTRRAGVVGAAMGAVGVTAIATGAIPTGGGTINGCYEKAGSLRVIDTDAGQACTKNEKPLAWNVAGPTGPLPQDRRPRSGARKAAPTPRALAVPFPIMAQFPAESLTP